jgi:CheY-like chemotaxis protein
MTDNTDTTRKKVLCIEDEHFIGELYVRALERGGYETKVVIDGADGLKEALTNEYDIILLDIMVPSMTGLEILRRLRGPEATKDIKAKIIITTNLEQGEEGREDVETHADAYIIKAEITPRQLVEFLDQLNT